MFKNTLKQVLAAAALGCLAVGAHGQAGFGSPLVSARWGGPIVSGMNVSYYNNGISSVGMPVSFGLFNPRLAAPSALNPINSGTVVNPIVRRMPADGTIVPLALGSSAGSAAGVFVDANGTVVNPLVRRMPANGMMVPLAIGSSSGSSFLVNGTVVNPTVRRMPANGMMVPLSAPRR